MIFHGILDGKRSQKTTERSTILNGKTHYFDWAMFNSYVCVKPIIFGKLQSSSHFATFRILTSIILEAKHRFVGPKLLTSVKL